MLWFWYEITSNSFFFCNFIMESKHPYQDIESHEEEASSTGTSIAKYAAILGSVAAVGFLAVSTITNNRTTSSVVTNLSSTTSVRPDVPEYAGLDETHQIKLFDEFTQQFGRKVKITSWFEDLLHIISLTIFLFFSIQTTMRRSWNTPTSRDFCNSWTSEMPKRRRMHWTKHTVVPFTVRFFYFHHRLSNSINLILFPFITYTYFSLGITKFADFSEDEFKKLLGYKAIDPTDKSAKRTVSVPKYKGDSTTVDWTGTYTTGVKDQVGDFLVICGWRLWIQLKWKQSMLTL